MGVDVSVSEHVVTFGILFYGEAAEHIGIALPVGVYALQGQIDINDFIDVPCHVVRQLRRGNDYGFTIVFDFVIVADLHRLAAFHRKGNLFKATVALNADKALDLVHKAESAACRRADGDVHFDIASHNFLLVEFREKIIGKLQAKGLFFPFYLAKCYSQLVF